jgi:hypothetical protein
MSLLEETNVIGRSCAWYEVALGERHRMAGWRFQDSTARTIRVTPWAMTRRRVDMRVGRARKGKVGGARVGVAVDIFGMQGCVFETWC